MAREPTDPLPLARHVFVDTDDPRRAQAETSKIFAPHSQSPGPGTGPFRALHHHARLANLSFNYIRYEPGLVISSGPMLRYYLLLIPQAGRCAVMYGDETIELRPGHVTVVNPMRPLRMTWMDNCAQCVVKVDRADLEARLAELLGEAPLRPLSFDTRQSTPRALCAGLVDFAMLAFRDLDLDKPVLSSRLADNSTERLFLALMLGDLPNSYSAALSHPRSRVAPYYVKRVEEFIRLHAGSPITLGEMVAVSGVSKRALFRGFREFRNMGPMAYLKSVRLESAHAELAGPAPERRSVTEVANAWGFTHLGNFARDYRRRFGRCPSETLRGRR